MSAALSIDEFLNPERRNPHTTSILLELIEQTGAADPVFGGYVGRHLESQ
jgi:hypothetical protein